MNGTTDISQFTYFDRKSLSTILPHRGSALRKIDGIYFDPRSPKSMTGIKEVRADDPDLDGHFPGSPTYPGYAQDEFLCLVAASLILYTLDGLSGNPYIVQKTAKYRKNVTPGDTLTATVELLGRRSRFFIFSGEIRNQNDEIVAEYEKIVGAI